MKELLLALGLSIFPNEGPSLFKQIDTVPCFLQGERVSEMNRICTYDCLGAEYVMTLPWKELCPYVIKR